MSNLASSRSFSEFDKMGTKELEKILRLDAQLPEGEDCDTELILHISEVIAKREQENSSGRLPDIDKAWNVFNEKYRPYAGDGRSLYEYEQSDITELSSIKNKPSSPNSTSPVRHMGRRLARAACAAAVIAILMFAATATAYALGYDLWGYVAEWSKETFGFTPENQAPSSGLPSRPTQNELSDLQAALDEYGITEKLIPKYIPQGFVQTEFYVDSSGGSNYLTSVFEKSEQTIIIDVKTNANIVHSYYEKDYSDPEIYEMNGVEHYIITNMGKFFAAWRTENYEVSILGPETKEELIKMIDSIYEEK